MSSAHAIPVFSNNGGSDPNLRPDNLLKNIGVAALFLGMMYIIVVFLVWRGVKRVFAQAISWSTLWIFCLALVIVPILRASAFIVHFLIYELHILGENPPQILQDLIMNSLYIGPSITYQFTYMVLICIWIEITMFSRDQFLIQHGQYNCVWKCVWGTITTLIISALVFFFIWESKNSNYNFGTGLYTSLWIMTFVTPTVAFLVWVILVIRFAGFPYLSNVWQQQTKRMNYVVIVWTVGQLIYGTMTAIWTYDEGEWMSEDEYIWFSLSLALTLLFSEIIPLIYTSDWQRMGFLLLAFMNWREMYIKDYQHGLAHDPRLVDDPLRRPDGTHHNTVNVASPAINTPSHNHNDNDRLLTSSALLSSSSIFSDSNGSAHLLSREQFNKQSGGKNGIIDFNVLQIDKSLEIPSYVYSVKGSSNAFYSTHRATMGDGKGRIADLHSNSEEELEFCLKSFEVEYIDSATMLQGIYDNLVKLKKMDHEHLAIIFAVNLKIEKHSGLKRMEILTPWYNGGSLYDIILMSPKDTPFAMHVIKRMMLQIASFMDWLHTKCKMAHGHLKSRNILFDHDFNVCVTDIGLISLKKTMTVLCPQCCFDGYWMERDYYQGKSIKGKTDVWAFGFIVYELIAKRQPFEGIEDINHIKKCIVNNSDMPQMPAHCDPFLNDLVHQCWNPDRSKRP